MPVRYSGRERVVSMSSWRRRNLPPLCRAKSCATFAARAWPRWSRPVGLGAKRVTGGVGMGRGEFLSGVERWQVF